MAKVGRNDPCPCGSGKKYKHCCGANHHIGSAGVKKSDLALEDFVLERLSEDLSFLADAIQFILGPFGYTFCLEHAEELNSEYQRDGLRDYVGKDGMGVFSNPRDDKLIWKIRPYGSSAPDPQNDIVTLFKTGYICVEGRQVELFHAYVLQNLLNRFDEYRYIPVKEALKGQHLGPFARRGYDFLLGITLYLELQLGVHAYFGLVNRWTFPDGGETIKKFFDIEDVPTTETLDTGLGLMLTGYMDLIGRLAPKYSAEEDVELYHSIGAYTDEEYPIRKNMIRQSFYPLPLRYDYIGYLRYLIPATCFNASGLYGKANMSFPQCDLIKYLFGLEEIVRLFEDKAEETAVDLIEPFGEGDIRKWENDEELMLRAEKHVFDRKEIYQTAVFWFMDELNGMAHSMKSTNLVYQDHADINEDDYSIKDNKHIINPARKSTRTKPVRKLRMEIYNLLNGKNFTLRIGAGPGDLDDLKIAGSYPILPWLSSGKEETLHCRPFDGTERPFEDLYSPDVNKRQDFLTLEYRLTAIPVNCIEEYLNPDVYYSWEERNQLLRFTQEQAEKLRQVNESLNRHIRLNHELVSNLSHSAANYLNSDKLAETGAELHNADDHNPTVEKLHMEGVSLILQAEQEMFLTRQLNSLAVRCDADINKLTEKIRSGLSRSEEEGVKISVPVAFALKTVLARVLLRDGDRRSEFIRSKLGKTEYEITALKSSFLLDVLVGGNEDQTVFEWWDRNLSGLTVRYSHIWETLRIHKEKAFFDLITELVTEQVLNAVSHGDIMQGIEIRFGQAEEFKGIPRWAYIECVNHFGEKYRGGTESGISTLNETMMLINRGMRGIEISETEDTFRAKVWLLSSLLKA